MVILPKILIFLDFQIFRAKNLDFKGISCLIKEKNSLPSRAKHRKSYKNTFFEFFEVVPDVFLHF